MPKPNRASAFSNRRPWLAEYVAASRRPLTIFVFLLPLVLIYEIGLLTVLRSQHDVLTNLAHRSLLQFFNIFGMGGLYLGGAAILVVLLIWHVLNRDPWRLSGRVLALMVVESALLAIPLLVLAQLIAQTGGVAQPAAALATGAPIPTGLAARVVVSIGAGLYEEFLFRMLVIALLHTLLVDVAKADHWVGLGVAIAVSAVLFTAAHPLRGATGELVPQRVAFYLLAGLYFAAVYVARGFGIAVATHAAYDIATYLFIMKS